MPRVILAGSENDTRFAVIDFTNPNAPTVVQVNPGFGAGCRVNIDSSSAAMGSVLTGDVRLVDVTNPAAPVLLGNINTMLAGIGAIAIRGTRVAVGEFVNTFQARVKLIDFSNAMSPTIRGTAQTPLTSVNTGDTLAAIASIAFLNDNVVYVSGPASPQAYKVDFTNPSSPVVTMFNPVLPGGVALDVDASAGRLAAGDTNGSLVKLFDANTQGIINSGNTMLGGVGSVSLKNPLVLAAGPNDINSVRLDFSGAPTVSSFNPGLGGGSTTAIEGTIGACGAILDTRVALIDLSVTPPTVLGTANANIASISTLAISTFMPPKVTVTPAAVTFGAVKVGTTKVLSLVIKNTGTQTLQVTGLASSNARYTFNPAGPFTLAANATATVQVAFAPNAESVFNASLTFQTNDPLNPNVSVSLTGQGALPHIQVSSGTLSMGNVAVCLSGSNNLTVTNTGGWPLTVSSLVTSGPPFAVSPASAVVAPGSSATVTIKFTPTTTGPASGTLTITSDDPNQPVKSVALSGTGLPTPPPGITVSPNSLVFGATPLQFFIGIRITIANTGPCKDLNVTLTSNGTPFFVTDNDPATVPPTSLTVSGTVPGNQSKRFVVVFAPTVQGAASGTLSITSNDPNNPTVTVPLTGNGVQLQPVALELVLDRSGSMAAAAPGGTKMDALKSAVDMFADLVIPGQGDDMGSVEFDDAFNVLTPRAAYDAAQQTAIKAGVASLTPRNFTSIGGGLQLGQSEVSASAITRKAILVFTDGLENTPPMIANVEPTILAAGTEIYAIGLGQPQNISSAALSALAASANGKFFQTDDTLILRKNFIQVLADAFRNNMAADPIFNLSQGAVVEIPVRITECERRISFILNWDDPASQVEMTIRAPDGTTYFPNSSLSNQLVRYGQQPGYRYYQIAFPPIDPGSGLVIGPPQLGTWTMRISGVQLARSNERCTTSVIVESDLELRSVIHAVDVQTPVQAVARITHNGSLVKDANVVMAVTSPLKSLAAVSTPQVVQRALDADHNPIPAGRKPLIPTSRKKYTLEFQKRLEGFGIKLAPVKVDGVYQFEFQADGKACGGVFDRYSAISMYIGRKPDRHASEVSVLPGLNPNTAVVTVVPRDRSGQPLGPGLASLIQTSIKVGTAHRVTDHGNGAYSFRIAWSPKRKLPAIELRVGGVKLAVRWSKSIKRR
jgi:Abnormal spindle-like microcephaly-assoc'd, ASPM-SPD-2-Hydin/von Willebrand factor type A domain